MFNLGFSEILVILALALILLGPKKLPELARSLGKGLRELRRATDDLKGVIDDDLMREPARPKPRPAPLPPAQTAEAAAEHRVLDEAWPSGEPGGATAPNDVNASASAEAPAAPSSQAPRGEEPAGAAEGVPGTAEEPERGR